MTYPAGTRVRVVDANYEIEKPQLFGTTGVVVGGRDWDNHLAIQLDRPVGFDHRCQDYNIPKGRVFWTLPHNLQPIETNLKREDFL